ncbi:hypothetical protein MPSEU_000920100 [Mayamaea pseudoterrestris]|nr:hypothetical protein MPSEU_000920100 [Mayamaea pseudoterrestris]
MSQPSSAAPSWRGSSGNSDRTPPGSGSSWRGGNAASAANSTTDRPRWTSSREQEGTPSMRGSSIMATPSTEGSLSRSRREPEKVNSRAAGLEMGGDRPRRDATRESDRTPPVLNQRFAGLSTSDDSRMTPQRTPAAPLVTNARFASVAESGSDNRGGSGNDRGGSGSSISSRFGSSDRTPPTSSGGAAGSWSSHRLGSGRDLGPPPTTNSRFAKAAEMAGREDHRSGDRGGFGGGDRGGFGGGGGSRNYDAPLAQNSRFANAAADDPDYVERGERERRMQDDPRGGRGGFRNDRYGSSGGGGRGGMEMPLPTGPRGSESEAYNVNDRVDELLKPKLKKEDEVVLKPPTKMHEENMLKFPAKALTKEEDTLFPTKKKEADAVPAKTEAVAPTQVGPTANVEELMAKSAELLKEFATGGKQGDELAQWVQENKVGLPAVDKLVFELLMENEKLNPNPECVWAEPAKFGAALLSLVEDDILGQMQVLWGIQLYCDKIGFPKLDGESICQAMFRCMYKFDLASGEAFAQWKEDESKEHMAGKTSAIIQTTDWFTWLDEDDDEDDEDYEDEE